jgi:hypothetical protein
LYLPIDFDGSWEKNLTIEDVEILIKFRKLIYPDVEREIRQLDSFASQLMIRGLIAYGWKQNELFLCQNNIIKVLKYHIPDFDKISKHQLLYYDRNASDNTANPPQDRLELLAEAAFYKRKRQCDVAEDSHYQRKRVSRGKQNYPVEVRAVHALDNMSLIMNPEDGAYQSELDYYFILKLAVRRNY